MALLDSSWTKLALIFPGQGSQTVGMGNRLSKVSRRARNVFKRADEVLERHISRLCYTGSEEELQRTINQQPATFVTSIAWLEAVRERWSTLDKKLTSVAIAGHSMGEFTAAVATGAITFEEGLLLVQERARLMDEAGRENPGGMASIIGLQEEKILEICSHSSDTGYVGIATQNCEGHTVISGDFPSLHKAMDLAQEAGARTVIPLPISIASHSPLMEKASLSMKDLLEQTPLQNPRTPIIGNVNAGILRSKEDVFIELRDQLTESVRWERCVQQIQKMDAEMVFEVGPGSVLTKLVRRIDKTQKVVSLSDPQNGLLSENFSSVEATAR